MIKTVLLSLSVLVSAHSMAEVGMHEAVAIDMLDEQRMLTQRMLKSHLMIGADIKTDEAARQLDDSVATFEERILAMQAFVDAHPELESGMALLTELWQNHRMNLLNKPEKANIASLWKENLKLMNACQDLEETIAAITRQKAAELILIAGKQRMLSQRIAKDYIAMAWHVEDEHILEDYRLSKQTFAKGLEHLKASPLNTAEITGLLGKIEAQWKFSEKAFTLDSNSQFAPTVISVTTESILKKMTEVIHLYEYEMDKAMYTASLN